MKIVTGNLIAPENKIDAEVLGMLIMHLVATKSSLPVHAEYEGSMGFGVLATYEVSTPDGIKYYAYTAKYALEEIDSGVEIG